MYPLFFTLCGLSVIAAIAGVLMLGNTLLFGIVADAGTVSQATGHAPASGRASLLLVQAACLALLLFSTAAIVRLGWSTLVRRADSILARLPEGVRPAGADEIDRLGAAIGGLSWRATTHQVDAANQRRLTAELATGNTLSLDCLQQIAELLVAAPPSAFTLGKALQSLELALGVDCAGLRLSSPARNALRCESLITTRGVPVALTEDGSDAGDPSIAVRLHRSSDGRSVRSLTVPLRRGEETIAVLAVQAGEAFHFDPLRIQLTRLAAMQMSLSVSGISHEREERRGALLEERAAIARELHDSLAQSLAFLKIQVAQLQVALREAPGADAAAQTAQELRQGVSSAYRQVKELIAAFRVRMGARGLGQALEEAVEEFGHKGGFTIALDDRLADCQLTVNEEFHVLQVIREALSNTVRHANADHVTVSLAHVAGGEVTAVIEDDGRGFAPDTARPAHYGLTIMRERATSLGGTLAVTPRPEGGTRVCLTFIPESAAPERVARGL